MEGSEMATAPEGLIDEPLQLIEFLRTGEEESATILLNEVTISRVFQPIGDLPISIICVCGPSRQGKSFLLGYMIRCLESLELEEDDWMGWADKKKPLKGFKFRNGTKPETQGIWVWSKPFIVKNDDGEQIAVLLVDTQGTYDEYSTSKDMSAIVGLSMLTSSVMIFNFFNNLQENTLSALNTYIQYGSLALEQSSGPPFQKLNFLIRDWNNPGQYSYGGKGGKQFLDDKLALKEGQPEEAKHVRQSIRKCFQELDCYLMPTIGEKALFPEFTGSIDELAPKFAKEMESFINNLISSETLTIKEILGEQVTASGLKSCLETYIDIFNSEQVPSAEVMWQATSQMSNNNVIEKAMKSYQDFLKKKLRGSSYLHDEDLERAHSAGVKKASELFKKTKKFGSPQVILEFGEKLEEKITAEFSKIKKQNKEKRQKITTQEMNKASEDFRTQLKDDFPFDSDSEFYEEVKIKRSSDQAKSAILEEFAEKLANESEENLAPLIQSLQESFENMFISVKNKNQANRANAEKELNSTVEGLAGAHRTQLANYFTSNPFKEDEAALQKAHTKAKTTTLELFEKRNKPGKKDFQKEYLAKLENEMDSNVASLKNEQKQYIQGRLLEADDTIKELRLQYDAELKEAVAQDDMDDDQLAQFHSNMESSILHSFREKTPFPRGSQRSHELETRLKEQLQEVCDKMKFQVAENQHRSLESYQKASSQALLYYKEEMKAITESDESITEDALEQEHQQVEARALKEYDDFKKIGVPHNAPQLKYDLKDNIKQEWKRIREGSKTTRELAFSKAQNCIGDAEAEYNRLMKTEVDSARDPEELQAAHGRAMAAAIQQLKDNCPFKDPTILNKYVEQLRESIEEGFEELQEVFELKQAEDDTTTKGMLEDGKQAYNDEMGKHFKNHLFISPTQLKDLHNQVKATVMKKCEDKTPLSHLQKQELETAFDDLLQIYEDKNDMNLNFDMGVAPAIGIDLGTTYCCVAVFYNGEVHIIPNHDQGGNLATASYVAFNADGSESYGGVAKDNAYKNPENTIYDAKRIIGRKMAEKELQEDMKFWPFVVQEDDGVPKIMADGKLLHPEQISSKLLGQFRGMAEKFLQLEPGTIKKAVITVPAYFNDGQRQATVNAGELAGYETVLNILNEPTAAAMAYSIQRLDKDPRKILIYDLGGGTFDVAVLDMTQKKIEVLGVKGHTHLGGEDFDKKLMEYCASSFKAENGIDLFAGKDSTLKQDRDEARRRLRRLQTHCEKAKRDLASARTAQVSVDAIVSGRDLNVDVTRDKFEELNMAYFEQSIQLVAETLRDVGLRKEDINDVVLVGGSSRIPKVQEMLSAFFNGKALNKSIHPDYAVAYGAAVQAALMNGGQAKNQIDFSRIQDVTPMSIGVEIYGGGFSIIIPRNTKIPVKAQERYRTAHNNQTSVQVTIYQGEKEVAVENAHLGDFYLNGIPPRDAEVENIDVEIVINAQGILHINAICTSTGEKKGITVTENKQRMSKALIKRLLSDARTE